MGARSTSITLVVLAACGAACGRDRDIPAERPSSRLEASIERELGAHLAVAVRVACFAWPPRCDARFPDGGTLPLRLTNTGGQLEWAVDGMVVQADAIEAYLRDVIADLGAPQQARCGIRVRRVAPGDRIECALERGGKAFITINADGTTDIELGLDPVAGDARAELITIAREQELVQMSLKLQHAGDPDDD